MKVFLPEVEVGDLDGFTPENDLFSRKPIGDGLSHLLANVSDPLVIALDAQWGAGKTVFLKQWAGELRKAGFPVIFFDAFANDFAEDAFAAIAGQVIALLEEQSKGKTTPAKRFLKQAWGAGKVLARSGLRAGVKIATLNVVDTKDLEEAAKIVGEELSRLEDESIGELLTRQRAHKATFEAFREALAEMPSVLKGEGEVRPLVFIIDELDRCRPAFALELMERIKHFFSVQNVHFVLGVHLEQLENSVAAAYGPGIDATTYLQKFIHLTVTLRDTARYDHERVTPRYLSHLAKALEIQGEIDGHLSMILHVAEVRQLSLRSLERIMTTVALAQAFTPKNAMAPRSLVTGLCILKVLEPALFEKAKARRIEWAQVRRALAFDQPMKERDDRRLERLAIWWRYVTGDNLSDEESNLISQDMWRYNFDSPQALLAWIGNELIERLQPIAS